MNGAFTEKPSQIYEGIPCYSDQLHANPYQDSDDLGIYLKRFEWHSTRTTIYDSLLLRNEEAPRNILSVGEGTGEFIASLAAKWPSIQFFAFDLVPSRAVIATHLMRHIGLKNVNFYIGSVEKIPFPENFFSGVMERSVFHVLPTELKVRHLTEINRVCHGRVVMGHMSNARKYLSVRWLQSKLHRNRRIWEDALFTYRMIDKKVNTLRKMAELVKRVTGHEVEILYHFRGDRELPYSTKYFRILQYLGGITYRTEN
jgi:ubiquinone/menaquinone biosynthesis C-methylase UbiE